MEQVRAHFIIIRRICGDPSASVRIWDIVGEDQVEKGEYKVISGKMYVPCVLFTVCYSQQVQRNDLEWDGESKRIIAVGDGREKCASYSSFYWM